MTGVKSLHPQYESFLAKWQRSRHVIAGQDAVRGAGEAYLPKPVDEGPNEYAGRIKRSNFFNGTWRTIAILHGMMFRKDPTLECNVEEYLKDVTMSGVSFERFARNIAGEVLGVGRVGILVDFPPVSNVTGITVAAANQMGLRPTMQMYSAESIINWKHRNIRNATVLSLVVLQEEMAAPDNDEFEHKSETVYRVLDLDPENFYRQRLYRINAKGKDEQIGSDFYPLMNGKPLDYIPFGICGTDGLDCALDEPPLINLVDANIAHYQVNADYRHGLHFTALPTLFLAGVTLNEGEKIHVGSTAAITSPDPNADGKFIEFTGQGLSETREALKEMKQEMAVLGARALADETKQAETLGGTAIKRSGENSMLSSIALAVSNALTWALKVFSEWAGQAGEVEFKINRDFMPTLMDAQTLTALVGAVQAGKISDSEFFELMQRGDVIDGAKTFDEHQAEVEIQTVPARPTLAPPSQEAA